MALTLPEALAHLRLEPDYPPDQVQPYVDAAADAAERYLNRRIFSDQAAFDAALDEVPSKLAAARVAYDAAVVAANALTDETERAAALKVACVRLQGARMHSDWTFAGLILAPSMRSAMLLTLGHLFANRSAVVVGGTAVELPRGALDLLRPYRKVMMP